MGYAASANFSSERVVNQTMAFLAYIHHKFVIVTSYEAFCLPDPSPKATGDHQVASSISSPFLSLSLINLCCPVLHSDAATAATQY